MTNKIYKSFGFEYIDELSKSLEEKYKKTFDLASDTKNFFDHSKRGDYEMELLFLNDKYLEYKFGVESKKIELDEKRKKKFGDIRKKYNSVAETQRAVDIILADETTQIEKNLKYASMYGKKILGLMRVGNYLASHDIREQNGLLNIT